MATTFANDVEARAQSGVLAMAENTEEFFKAAELYRLARMHSSGAVPDEFRESLPIPVRQKNGLQMAFFFAAAVASPKEGVKIGPPGYLAFLDAESGRFLNLRAVAPRDFGQKHGENEVIGAVAMPPNMTAEEYLAKRERLFALYDALIPLFVKDQVSSDKRIKEIVAEFLQHFALLSEAPLLPYYRAVGKDFFAWLDRFGIKR